MKKWLGLTMTAFLSLALVLSGCSQKTESPAASSSTSTETAPSSNSAEPKDKFSFPLEEKLTLKIVAYKETFNKVSDYNVYDTFQQLEKDTNVHIDWTLHDTTTREEKLNLMAASGDYPDALYGALPSGFMLSSFAEQGIAIPLNDLIDQYAPNLKKAFEENPAYQDMVTHSDGKIYSLPVVKERPFQEAADSMFINKNWLDQVGLGIPTTTDELYTALKAFKGKDLNGNGKIDEIPISFQYHSFWKGGHSLAMSFDVMDDPDTHTYVKDGKVLYAPQQEEYREYVSYINKLYSEGLLDQEVFTQDSAVYKAKRTGTDPILGVISMPTNVAFTNSADYVPLLGLKGPKGHFGWTWDNPGIFYGAFIITSANKNPEITMKWIDSHYDFEFGLQMEVGPIGKGIEKISDNKYVSIKPPEGVSDGDYSLSLAPGWAAPKIIPAKNYIEEIFISKSESEELEMYMLKKPLLKYTPIKSKIYDREDYDKIESINEINAMNGYIDQIFAEFVIRGITDKSWSAHLAQLEKMGVNDYLELVSKYE